ncbi:putative Auxin-induced protein X10A [Cocos nucifera]|nr:putative Auxin-induced protein X10A [Cocos nucifera]
MFKKGKREEIKGYKRLAADEEDQTPEGYVPVLVGKEPMVERFIVEVELFREPCMARLLDMAANEFGYPPQGILRIPCDINHFRQVIGKKSRVK